MIFGLVPVGQTASQTLTLANDGGGPLRLTHVGFVGSGQFSLALGPAQLTPAGSAVFAEPIVVAPGEAAVAVVTFAPFEPGHADASLVLFSNDPAVDDDPHLDRDDTSAPGPRRPGAARCARLSTEVAARRGAR